MVACGQQVRRRIERRLAYSWAALAASRVRMATVSLVAAKALTSCVTPVSAVSGVSVTTRGLWPARLKDWMWSCVGSNALAKSVIGAVER